jgi:hypothetical protein
MLCSRLRSWHCMPPAGVRQAIRRRQARLLAASVTRHGRATTGRGRGKKINSRWPRRHHPGVQQLRRRAAVRHHRARQHRQRRMLLRRHRRDAAVGCASALRCIRVPCSKIDAHGKAAAARSRRPAHGLRRKLCASRPDPDQHCADSEPAHCPGWARRSMQRCNTRPGPARAGPGRLPARSLRICPRMG